MLSIPEETFWTVPMEVVSVSAAVPEEKSKRSDHVVLNDELRRKADGSSVCLGANAVTHAGGPASPASKGPGSASIECERTASPAPTPDLGINSESWLSCCLRC